MTRNISGGRLSQLLFLINKKNFSDFFLNVIYKELRLYIFFTKKSLKFSSRDENAGFAPNLLLIQL